MRFELMISCFNLSERVAVADTSDVYQGTMETLKRVDAADYLRGKIETGANNRILIKPNYVTNDMPKTGVTTDPLSIIGAVDYLLESGFNQGDIVIGEGGATMFDTYTTFRKVGLLKLLENYDVEVVDLNKDKRVRIDIPRGKKLTEVDMSETFVKSVRISVSKLKIHHTSKVTLGLKNTMGGILPKSIVHGDIHQKIVDLNTVFAPVVSVIDGVIGCESHETAGSPVRSDVCVSGTDVVAADAVGAYLMGYEPGDVDHIVLAGKAGIGSCEIDLSGIQHLRKRYRQ